MRKTKLFFIPLAFLCVFVYSTAMNSFANETLNTLTITSINFDNKPLYGFVYEIKEKGSMNTVARADMKATNTWRTELKDGQYVIVETERPEGYDKAKDVSITLPYKMNDNDSTRRISFTPKHVLKTDKPLPPNPTPNHVNTGDYINLMFYIGILLIGVGSAGLSRRGRNCKRL